MKRIILITGIVLFVSAVIYTGLPVLEAQYSSLNYKEPGGARTVIGGDIDIVDGGELNIEDGGGFYMEPTNSAPTAEEGWIYFNDSNSALTFHSGTGWVTLSSGTGDNTLDLAYDESTDGAGRKVVVDTGAIEFEVPLASDNPALHLDCKNTTNDPVALLIENAADETNAITIDIDAQTSGWDIAGTGDSWYITGAGALTAVSATIPTLTVATSLTAGSGIILDNDETITNATDGEIKFSEDGGENLIFDLAAGSNVVELKTSSGLDEFAFGAIDDLSGIGSIAFDTVASTITIASASANADLTIEQTGGNDSSIHILAAGTGTDAITVKTSAGGMDITVAGSGDGEDLDILSSRSLTLTSSEDTVDAIKINASAGGIDIDAVGESGQDIIITNTGGSIQIVATENQANAIVIDASDNAGGIDIDAGTNGIAIDITGDADFRVDVSDGRVILIGAKDIATAITINAEGTGGGIDMDFGTAGMVLTGNGTAANLTIDVDALSFDFTDSSNITVTSSEGGEDLTISQVGSNDSSIIITSAGQGANAIELTTSDALGDIDINAGDAITIDAGDIVITTDIADADQFKVVAGGTHGGDVINLGATDGGIVLTAGGSTNGDVTITAASKIDLAAEDDITITLTAGTAGEDLSFITTGSADSSIVFTADGTAANAIDINTSAGGIDIDMTGGIAGEDFDITTATSFVVTSSEAGALDAIDLNVTGAVSGIDMDTTNGPITLTAGNATNGDITITAANDFTLAVTGTTTLPNNQLRRRVVLIEDTDMDQLATTQITLVPTPGASAYIEFVSAIFALKWNSVAYTESAPDDLAIKYTDDSGAIVSQLLDATDFATATVDVITQLNPVSDIVGGTTAKPTVAASACVNQPLILDNTGSDWGNNGDSDVTVIIYYRIHTTTELGL